MPPIRWPTRNSTTLKSCSKRSSYWALKAKAKKAALEAKTTNSGASASNWKGRLFSKIQVGVCTHRNGEMSMEQKSAFVPERASTPLLANMIVLRKVYQKEYWLDSSSWTQQQIFMLECLNWSTLYSRVFIAWSRSLFSPSSFCLFRHTPNIVDPLSFWLTEILHRDCETNLSEWPRTRKRILVH